MKLTPFGEAVRIVRMRNALSLKAMAEAMGISSAYLSALEFGDKRLSQKHIDAAVDYLKGYTTLDEQQMIVEAAGKSKKIINTEELSPEARGYMSAFARRLAQGDQPTEAILAWLGGQSKK